MLLKYAALRRVYGQNIGKLAKHMCLRWFSGANSFFSLKSKNMFPLRFATRRFCCFRPKTRFSEQKTNQVGNFLMRHNTLSGNKKEGNIWFFWKTVFLSHFSFAKEILENHLILLVSETLKSVNIALLFLPELWVHTSLDNWLPTRGIWTTRGGWKFPVSIDKPDS